MAMELAEIQSASLQPAVQNRATHKQLAMHEALRRLGFNTNEIFATWEDGPRTLIWVAGNKFLISYPYTVYPGDGDRYLSEWLDESRNWKLCTEADKDKIFKTHVSPEMIRLLSMALRARGFKVSPQEN